MAIFNPNTKTWKGTDVQRSFEESDSLGKSILNQLNKNLNKVIQINDNNGVSINGAEMRLQGIRVAENLKSLGLRQNDVISIIARNNHQLTPALLGCLLIGAPVNPLDPKFVKVDLNHMFNLTKPKAIFCEFDKAQVVIETLRELNHSALIFVFSDVTMVGTISINELFRKTGTENSYQPPDLGEASKTVAGIICSSGTTGAVKGVTLSHAQFLVKLDSFWEPDPDAVMLTFSSLYWVTGIGIMLMALLQGASRIMTDQPFSAELFFRIVEKYRVTHTFTSPAVLGMMLNDPGLETADLSSMKRFLCGGSLMPQSFKDKMSKYLHNTEVIAGYGMTEFCAAICTNKECVPGPTVGSLRLGIEVKIVDVDDSNNHYGVNEDGEICIKSHPKFLGYFANPKASEEVLDGDWIRTGDIGHFDEKGFLYLVDRKKDILKYLNYQIPPSEIEELITNMDGVHIASVVGIPDDLVGDLIAALVVKSANSLVTADEIIQRVADSVTDFKHLRGGVYFVEQLPLTPSGKVQKRKVKDLAIQFYKEQSLK